MKLTVPAIKADFEKFEKWAETVPYTLRNPLYHWTHLELQRYFDVHEVLSETNAREVYETCTAKLQTPEFSVRNLLRKMNVVRFAPPTTRSIPWNITRK